ncbi:MULTISPECIES: ABC transporter ATP-binding protein [Aerococcus]|uniref:ABC transporter ATP-binding protein n=1 Tax=Aerococcus TaxID=1375 RepID=UPI0018A72A45|nr:MULTISPECIES: ATP-binding cassette domain-containing protein [Aerococcus]MCY3040177.1 ATP-binding cassette domain-containing protein [Aerococcus sp. Group 2]MCY3041900.1 ATP-binding cassette domain-containing protein [Aerococcus sp. Group 2]MCY3043570.1 ATP-binding cassette domain-containing protein [Aerococcus sp. Group 2]MDK6520162.1 ATP-binding cassette domain-containing protein [Aerococcus urinae]
MIKIDHVTKSFDHHKGIFDISLEVADGQVMGFIGPNGAGKSTTIRHLMGFLKADKGTLTINGLDCWREADQVKKGLGYLPGEIVFPSGLSAHDFLAMQREIHRHQDTRLAEDLIDRFQLNMAIPIHKMSKGMKQKLALVACFMCDPDIIILDEPSTGLDPLMQEELIQLLREEKAKGKTIFLSSHVLEEIERIADEICIIKEGRIVKKLDIAQLHAEMKEFLQVTLKDEKPLSLTLPGIEDLGQQTYRIPLEGDYNALLRELAQHDIADLRGQAVTLRELFQKYYREGD